MATLYIAATPIGNLEDITLRVLRVLKEADLILAEDTRQTKKLLDHYDIDKKIVSYHEHSRLAKVDFVVDQLRQGKDLVLVSDAGTPGLADPGGQLVAKVWELDDPNIKVVPLPGPAALMTAISVAGIKLKQFDFLGFFPKKKGRKTLLDSLSDKKNATVFYESPHRIVKTLTQLAEAVPEREVFVGRELTKKFEELWRGSARAAADHFTNNPAKGEFVVILSGK